MPGISGAVVLVTLHCTTRKGAASTLVDVGKIQYYQHKMTVFCIGTAPFALLPYKCLFSSVCPSMLYLVSISGLLCRSTVWEGKFRRHRAASNVPRIAFRYGRRVFACPIEYGGLAVGELTLVLVYKYTPQGQPLTDVVFSPSLHDSKLLLLRPLS